MAQSLQHLPSKLKVLSSKISTDPTPTPPRKKKAWANERVLNQPELQTELQILSQKKPAVTDKKNQYVLQMRKF
jgi:hypothetical protein